MKKRTKKTLSIASKVFIRLVLATVLCAILYVSMNVISTAFFSDVVGYRIYQQDENQEVSQIEEYYYQPGEEEVKSSDLDLPDNQMFTAIRVVSDKTKAVMDVISQILMLIILGIFPYHVLWNFGNRDDTNVRYRGQRPDPVRGLKIGCLAMAPFALFWLILVISKYVTALGGFMQIYRLTVFPYLPYVNWIIGDAATASTVSVGRLFALLPVLLVVPAVCGIAYRMGGRQFSIAEFITFTQKNKNTNTDDEI